MIFRKGLYRQVDKVANSLAKDPWEIFDGKQVARAFAQESRHSVFLLWSAKVMEYEVNAEVDQINC